jgi:hypothetical protein
MASGSPCLEIHRAASSETSIAAAQIMESSDVLYVKA